MLITTNTDKRRKIFSNKAHAREAIECLYRVQELYPFFLYAFVIMPDHCHFLVRVPFPTSISTIMRAYKCGLCYDLGIGAFWQSRFHLLMPEDPILALNYVHQNPVKAGITKHPEDYPWSSASGKWDVTDVVLW